MYIYWCLCVVHENCAWFSVKYLFFPHIRRYKFFELYFFYIDFYRAFRICTCAVKLSLRLKSGQSPKFFQFVEFQNYTCILYTKKEKLFFPHQSQFFGTLRLFWGHFQNILFAYFLEKKKKKCQYLHYKVVLVNAFSFKLLIAFFLIVFHRKT